MKSIGAVLQESRSQAGISLDELEDRTKIKKAFLISIEKEQWSKLPAYPVVVGFVKNIAANLELDREKAVALLRRDYPPQEQRVNPKPDLAMGLRWGPKVTFALGIAIVLVATLTYLGKQYLDFRNPPELTISEPKTDSIVNEPEVRVLGVTSAEASVIINNQPVRIEKEGHFEAQIDLIEGENKLEIVAESRDGKVTEQTLKVIYNPED